MDFLKFFGKNKKESNEEEQKNATIVINNLRDQVSMMEKRNTAVKTRIDVAISEAKQKLDKKDKNGALIALKRKKQYDAEIEKNQGIQLVLENQIYSLEGITMQKTIVDALTLGNKSIKKFNMQLNSEKIEELMDDIQEEADNFKMIQDAMAQPLQQVYNDTELLDELEQLENDMTDKKLELELPESLTLQNQRLPNVPTKGLPKLTADEELEQELAQIKDSMNVL